MLHKEPFIVKPETFQLIQSLQALPLLKDFYLVGGTALALQLGHRNSIDIDLFSQNEFQPDLIGSLLSEKYSVEISFTVKNTLLSFVNKVKVDFISHNYPFIKPPISEEGITYLSLQDIAAMKLNVISNSGKRLKDFIDIYFLLEHFSLNEMIGFYSMKYPNINSMIPLRAVSYFDDIDPSIDPPNMRNKITLNQIKKRVNEAVLFSKKRFNE